MNALILFSHIHIFKYEGRHYTRDSLLYTRIGLGDSNNNSLSIAHCPIYETKTSCFYITKDSNLPITGGICSADGVSAEEMEDHPYMSNEPLLFDQSRDNQVLISKTNNLMPGFLDNFLQSLG